MVKKRKHYNVKVIQCKKMSWVAIWIRVTGNERKSMWPTSIMIIKLSLLCTTSLSHCFMFLFVSPAAKYGPFERSESGGNCYRRSNSHGKDGKKLDFALINVSSCFYTLIPFNTCAQPPSCFYVFVCVCALVGRLAFAFVALWFWDSGCHMSCQQTSPYFVWENE